MARATLGTSLRGNTRAIGYPEGLEGNRCFPKSVTREIDGDRYVSLKCLPRKEALMNIDESGLEPLLSRSAWNCGESSSRLQVAPGRKLMKQFTSIYSNVRPS